MARATSADGSVIVGYGTTATADRAFRWTSGGGMQNLGDLSGGTNTSYAFGVSADGSVVVGKSGSALGDEAFYWTAAGGMQNLRELLIVGGATGLSGWTLHDAIGVSEDGRTVVGFGTNPSGDKEAWVAVVGDIDWGDTPAPYPTLLSENGPRHVATGPRLGATRDGEPDGVHSADADADGADEDGVTFGTIRVGALDATATINVQSSAGKLDAWIDFNGDGSWGGPGEQIADDLTVSLGNSVLSFDVPSWAADGVTFARFRLSTAGDLGVGGAAADGEVEDYAVIIIPPAPAIGLFGAQKDIAGGVVANDVLAADIDGDGDMDALSASFAGDEISWYENNGPQNDFTAHVISTAADGPESVFAADLDSDGDMDVLSASYDDSTIAWHENDGSQNFTRHTITTSADGAIDVFTMDMDGDGDTDVLAASSADDTVAWYENDGAASFTQHVITSAVNAVNSVFAADVDSDGDMDVLSAQGYNNYYYDYEGSLSWYENDGNLSFTAHNFNTEFRPFAVFATDMDSDGDLDISYVRQIHFYGGDEFAWLRNDGGGSFTKAVIFDDWNLSPTGSYPVDLDGDSDTDLLASANFHTTELTWFENDGSQNYSWWLVSNEGAQPGSVSATDLDGDGDLDVLAASTFDGKIVWYPNLVPPTDISLSGQSVAENQPVAAVVGTLSTADPDADDSFVYALVSGPGDSGNSSFTIDGDQLKTAAAFNFEQESSYSVRIRSTDSGGLSIEEVFTVTVTNVNEPPTANAGGPYTIYVGDDLQLAGSGNDPDAGAVLTYSWDLNGDNVFGDAAGAFPLVPWSVLSGLGLGAGTQVISLRVTDDATNTATTDTSLDIYSRVLDLSPASLTLAEGDSGTTAYLFTVTLSAASGQTVTVAYDSADGSATIADNDYAPANGTLTFAPGQTVQLVTVLVNGDTTNEANEDFALNLSNPENAVLGAASVALTIVDDDGFYFFSLGDLPGGTFSSEARAVSSDGAVVAGVSQSASGQQAYRFSGGSMVGLGDLPGGSFNSVANALSSDGTTVVGNANSASGTEASRWVGGVLTGLGDLAGGTYSSRGRGVSADGSVVVGQGTSASGIEAFRWTSGGGMVGLGDLSGGTFESAAYATNGDGSVVVGFGFSGSGQEAFRWTSAGGMVGLGDFSGGAFASMARGASADGSVVVGYGTSSSGDQAFRWTIGGGMVGLGDLPGGTFQSYAYGVSGDGSVVVGGSATASGNEAFYWTAAGGMRNLRETLIAAGVTGLSGWMLEEAIGISQDGHTVVGFGTNPGGNREAWVAGIGDLDWGDAPAPYPTLSAENGARHVAAGPRFGATRDGEPDGVHSANADADGADEDGVTFGTIRVGALDATATVNVQSSAGKLDAWIDFNGDGSWGGPGEQIADNLAVSLGDNVISFDVPSWAADGVTFARFRLSTAGDLGVTGQAADGEVEDYAVTIVPPAASNGTFGDANIISSSDVNPLSVFAADLDGDGDMDVLSASYTDDTIRWHENDGARNFTAHTISSTANGAERVFAADVDGDGDTDVLAASHPALAWYENDGNQLFTAHHIYTALNGFTSVFAVDLDNDGDTDVLSAAWDEDRILWHENDGAEGFLTHTVVSSVDGPIDVSAADLDGDGDLDVLATLGIGDAVAWYENGGSQNFTPHIIASAVDGAWSIFAADIDSDGDMDVLNASTNNNSISWYENLGGGSFASHTISAAAGGPRSVFAADVDGDGDTDILSTNNGKVAWYENDGVQNFTAQTIATTANSPQSVFAADMDGDGDLDVLSASVNDDKIAWYENGAMVSSTVAARHIFYNQSAFDGNSAAINAADDGAIATDKTAYLPGAGLAVFENITSYSRGINGIMVDLSSSASHTSLTANDFVFKVGANNSPNTWAAAPPPSAISVRTGAGTSGADRVEITWANGDIQNQWLMVATKANLTTGLSATITVATPGGPVSVGDIFFFGNRIGDTGSPTATSFTTTVADASTIVSGGLGAAGGITNVRDIDKSNTITVAGDRAAALVNIGALNRLQVGTGGPFAPEDGDTGISSALGAAATTPAPAVALPPGIARRLRSGDLNFSRIAAYFRQVAESDAGRFGKLAAKADLIDNTLELDEELVGSLAGGL
ncbi:MAG: FG-GAP-like repeat-containing protein [Pirellulales bacterium]